MFEPESHCVQWSLLPNIYVHSTAVFLKPEENDNLLIKDGFDDHFHPSSCGLQAYFFPVLKSSTASKGKEEGQASSLQCYLSVYLSVCLDLYNTLRYIHDARTLTRT